MDSNSKYDIERELLRIELSMRLHSCWYFAANAESHKQPAMTAHTACSISRQIQPRFLAKPEKRKQPVDPMACRHPTFWVLPFFRFGSQTKRNERKRNRTKHNGEKISDENVTDDLAPKFI